MKEILLTQIATFDYCIKEVEEDIEYVNSNNNGLEPYSTAYYDLLTLVSRLKNKRQELEDKLEEISK